MTRVEEILRKAMNSYPDCPERGFGTGDYEYPEFHDDEREAFIEGAKWADCNPNQQIVKKMHDDLKTTYDVLNEMFEDYEDARLGVAYRFIGEVLEDLELLIDEEE